MSEDIAKANIEHFEKLLKTEADPKKRAVIERLLSAEKLKAAALRRARL
jgi:hypothetical protein